MTVRFALLLFVLLACPHIARAQVHKCVSADGLPLYTDQKCAALGATEAPPEPAPTTIGSKLAEGDRQYRGGCTRTLQDLVFELRTAIEHNDANRLSSIYHWVGASEATAEAVMARLERIAQRPLLDIQPVSANPEAEGAITGEADVPRTTVRRPPVGLRLEQTLPDSITPASTVLGLRRHYGCWFVSL